MSKPQSRLAAVKPVKVAVKPVARAMPHGNKAAASPARVTDLNLSALLPDEDPGTSNLIPDVDALPAVPEMSMEMSARAFREDPALDRRIIEGMLEDKDAFLERMAGKGYAKDAVLRRAAELGLSEALIRQVKGVAADLAGERPGRRPAPSSLGARTCLSCDRIFLSSGPGNRLCMRCRGGDAGLAQL
jgi:hypothetical protein